MRLLLLAALGGAIGSALRHLINRAGLALFGPGFPWWTLFVNVTGSLAMGLLAAWLMGRASEAPDLRVFLATGILGGYTTFSAFSLDVADLVARREMVSAMLYAGGSVTLSLAAVFAGLALGRMLTA